MKIFLKLLIYALVGVVGYTLVQCQSDLSKIEPNLKSLNEGIGNSNIAREFAIDVPITVGPYDVTFTGVTYSGTTSTWTYTVERDDNPPKGTGLSHWIIGLGSCVTFSNIIAATIDGVPYTNISSSEGGNGNGGGTECNPTGNFLKFDGLPDNLSTGWHTYTFTLNVAVDVSTANGVWVKYGNNCTAGTIDGPGCYHVKGKVTNQVCNSGVPEDDSEGITVQLYDATGTKYGSPLTIGADGNYEFKDVPAGSYVVKIFNGATIIDSENITVGPGSAENIDFFIGAICGKVTKEKCTDGVPVNDESVVQVTLSGGTTPSGGITDDTENGYYEFEGLQDGINYTVSIPESKNPTIAANGGINFTIGAICGKVTKEKCENGISVNDISAVQVTLSGGTTPSGGITVPTVGGYYEFEGLKEGTYTVSIPNGDSKEVTLPPVSTVGFDLTIKAVCGRVTKEVCINGAIVVQAAAGETVSLSDGSTTNTDGSGYYGFVGLKEGTTYTVSIPNKQTTTTDNINFLIKYQGTCAVVCSFSQGYWFAKPNLYWGKKVIIGGKEYTQDDGKAIWNTINTSTRKITDVKNAFTQLAAIKLSGVDLSAVPATLAADVALIEKYFESISKIAPATIPINSTITKPVGEAAGRIGTWISTHECSSTY